MLLSLSSQFVVSTFQIHVRATNQHVVPYSPWLLYMFDCHLNIEICSTVKMCKYIYKYAFKVSEPEILQSHQPFYVQGPDKAIVAFCEQSRTSNGTRDGRPRVGGVSFAGHVVLPDETRMTTTKRVAIQRDAIKRLKDHHIDRWDTPSTFRTSNDLRFDNNKQQTVIYDETIIVQSMRAVAAPEALLTIYQVCR